MANIKQDKYELGQSENKTINNLGEEIRLDLDLVINSSNNDDGQIFGTVSDATGNGIENAYVTLMNKNYKSLKTILTDEFGKYSFGHLVAEIDYKIFVKADGKELSQGPPIFLNPFEQRELNFNLQNNPDRELSIIAADVVDSESGDPLENITISIYSLDDNGMRDLKAILYTNEYGQFVFREGVLGRYVININYGDNVKKNLNTLNSNEKEVIVDLTETGSIVPLNISVETTPMPDVLSPGYLYFELQYMKNYRIKKYIATNGVMGNNAYENPNTGFVKALGTSRDGYIAIDIIVPRNGAYSIGVQYLTQLHRILSLSVNGGFPINVYCYKTKDGYVESARIRYISVSLKKGVNNLKFYNYFKLDTPEIHDIFVDVLPYASTIDISKETLTNGATAVNGGYVANIGGSNDGRVYSIITVPFSGDYVIGIKYLSAGADRPMKIYVDNGTRINGNFSKTPTNDAKDGIEAVIGIGYLNKGPHTIEFYNDTGAVAIMPGPTQVRLLAPIISTTASKGTLGNDARLSDIGFAYFLGGRKHGSITFNINTSRTAYYSIGVEYINADFNTGTMKVSINGVVNTYNFPKTPGSNEIDAKFFYFETIISSTNNIIKFYNDQDTPYSSPSIRTIYIQELLINDNKPNITLFGDARYDRGTIVGIGYNKGYANIKFNDLPFYGMYDFLITYITFDNDKEISLDVNNISLGEPFPAIKNSGEVIHTLSVPIDLNIGTNIIKVYNTEYLFPPKDSNSYSPYFTSFELFYTQLTKNTIRVFARDGHLQNGAEVLPSGYVHKIGGSNYGMVTITINTPFAGNYLLGIQYVNGDGIIGNMRISANGAYPTNYVFPKTNSNNTADAKIFYLTIELQTGNNIIRLYNNTGVSTQSPVINELIFQQMLVDTIYTIPNDNIDYFGKARALDGKVINIGYDSGYATLNYKNMPYSGTYHLIMNYVTLNDKNTCNISVNGISPRSVYYFNKTNSLKEKDAKSISISVNFKNGDNTIKIYNKS